MSATSDEAAQLIYTPNVLANAALTDIKFLSACFSGAVAGILGLENWLGFALFLSSTLFTALCIHTINCGRTPSKFISGGLTELLNPGQDNAFTFVLVWTLFYGKSARLPRFFALLMTPQASCMVCHLTPTCTQLISLALRHPISL